MTGIHQREEAIQDDLRGLDQRERSLEDELRTLRREIAEMHAAIVAARPAPGTAPGPTHAPTAPLAPALAPPPAPTFGQHARGPTPTHTPSSTGPSRRDSRPYKRARPMDPPALPPQPVGFTPAVPVAGPAVPLAQPLPMQPAPPPLPLPGMLTDHPAIVRFGRVRWAVQPAILRQQVYTCGRAAWDAYPGLFPSITDLTLQPDDHEFAELTFPSGSLARSFVEAWQRHRGAAGEWRRLQVHLV
ncbi:hypothetical protein K466DRAFT_604924 [Polyporus arcularius HHB13444]|uniref:Uncharacterized protein n=2 Tax=Polyporaceae TaxID=5317 RepID=A0A5C3NTW2_9APHY|nr:hypothetical protein K466DRAFT_604924 [Polyporus arcularius HHB13444]